MIQRMSVRSSYMLALIGLSLSLCGGVVAAAPVNCGSQPIRLAFYDYGLFHFINDQDKKPIPTIYINKGGYSWLGTMWRS